MNDDRFDQRLEVMGRKSFNAWLYDVYECVGQNTVEATKQLVEDDIETELFYSPAGPITAVHIGAADRVVVSAPIEAFNRVELRRAPSRTAFIDLTAGEIEQIRRG